jgi:hypothetical protein
MVSEVSVSTSAMRYFSLTRFHKVTEDLVRYMKAASQDSTFLVDDPIWAEDFAPNGKYTI